jgi:hypothetical protein
MRVISQYRPISGKKYITPVFAKQIVQLNRPSGQAVALSRRHYNIYQACLFTAKPLIRERYFIKKHLSKPYG